MVTDKKPSHRTAFLSRWLVESVILLLPTYLLRFHVGGIGFNVLDVVIAVAFMLYVIGFRRLRLGYWKYSMAAFLIIAVIGFVVSPDRLAALGLLKSYIIAPMLVGTMVLTIRPQLSRVVGTFAIVIAYVVLIALVQYLTGFGIPAPWNIRGEEFRLTSIFEYPNAVGLFVAPVIALIFAYCIHARRREWWLVGTVAFGAVALVLSRSDGGLLAFAAALMFTMLYTRHRWWAISFTIAVSIGALFYPPSQAVLFFQDTSGEVRLALWQGTINLLQHHPFVGAGLAGFPDLYAQYKLARHSELLLYPHNLFLDFWVELGILGLVWLIIHCVWFFVTLQKKRSPETIVLMSAMVAIVTYGLVDVVYFKNDLAVVFWLLMTLASTLRTQTTQ